MFFKDLYIEIKEVAVPLFKILIPFVFAIKFMEEVGVVTLLSKILAPLVAVIGLPPELGLVLMTGFIVNIYAALILFINIIPGLDLSVANVTILTTALLICHNLLVESAISKSAGVSFIYVVFFRLISAFIICFILNVVYSAFDILNEPYQAIFTIEPMRVGFNYWLQDQALNLIYIFMIVVVMVTILKLFRVLGIESLLKRIMIPVLKMFGIGKDATNIIIVGMVIGLQFGGGIVIKEVKNGKIDKQSVFLSLCMLNLVHGVIEDTILMLTVGGHYSGVVVARIILGLLISLLMFNAYKKYHLFFEKYVFNKTLIDLPKI